MKCSDCDNLGWVSDEGEQVWGWCWYSRSCPDPDIDRDCPNFALKRPPMLQQLKAENAQLRAELEQVKQESDAAVDCCSGYCASCLFVKDCAKHDMNDAAPTRWYYGDCEDWEWRGWKEG